MIKEGTVSKIFERTAGRGTAYTVYLKDDKSPYGCGFDKPPCTEGDVVRFEAEKNRNNYWDIVKNSVEVVAKAEAVQAPPRSGGRPAHGGGGGNNGRDFESAAERAMRRAADEKRQNSISRQASRNAAIEFIKVARELDCIPFPASATSAGKRFDVLRALVNDLTDAYHEDSMSHYSLPTTAVESESTGGGTSVSDGDDVD